MTKKHPMQKINTFLSHPLIKASAITFFGSLIVSMFNFFFNLFMSRNLSPEDFGTLTALVSLTVFFGLVGGAVSPTLINFSAVYFAKNDHVMIRWLFFKMSKYALLLGGVSFLFFFLFREDIGKFFNIHNTNLIFLAGLIIFLGFLGLVNVPVLQGKLAFKFLSFINIVVSSVKLFLGILFILGGFSVFGAIWAILFSQVALYALSFIPIRFIFQKVTVPSQIKIPKLFSYGLPAALALFFLNSLINTDIILVKHFFNPKEAGIYAGVSLIGKVVFYFSAPIGTVMFPLIVQKYEKKENYDSFLKLSLALVLLGSILIVIFYFLFPEVVINFFLKNKEYLKASSLIGIYGILIAIYALLSIVVNFYLSIKRTKVFIPLVIASLTQVVLVSMYHQSFLQIITMSLVVILTVFIILSLPIIGFRVSRLNFLSQK
ncbi:oligosaccharide flippase family protein [Patescibacteria group bacterium]|nr:oligosaccharide flippase family protein [Patescibacteria group bacterium]